MPGELDGYVILLNVRRWRWKKVIRVMSRSSFALLLG